MYIKKLHYHNVPLNINDIYGFVMQNVKYCIFSYLEFVSQNELHGAYL